MEIEMIHALLFTFSENHKTELFQVLFTKEDDGKAARWIIVFCN